MHPLYGVIYLLTETMAKRGRKKKIQPQTEVIPSQTGVISGTFSKVNLSESYVSLSIGLIVVIFAAILTIALLKQKNMIRVGGGTRQEVSSTSTQENSIKTKEQIYTVAEGDELKAISLKFYGSEDYYLDIAKANKIDNPDIISTGTQLKIPAIGAKASGNEKITTDTYTAKDTDDLWGIAVRAYGDGFKWVDIAKINNLIDFPDSLTPGTVLKIPR